MKRAVEEGWVVVSFPGREVDLVDVLSVEGGASETLDVLHAADTFCCGPGDAAGIGHDTTGICHGVCWVGVVGEWMKDW